MFVTHNLSSETEYMMLQPGTEIMEVNDQNIHAYVSEEIAPFVSFSTPQDSVARIFSSHFTRGSITEPVKFKCKTTDGEVFVRRFRRKHNENVYPHAKGFSYSKLNETTNLLTVNTFYDTTLIPFLDSIFSKVPHPQNLIVDLRMNAGGNSSNGFELLGYLVDKPFTAMKSACRKYRPHYRGGGGAPDEI